MNGTSGPVGSAPILIQSGLSESLARRFEVVHLAHWSLSEMREAFAFGLDDFLYFGGYPGAAGLVGDPECWGRYVRDSLIETTISRDVLLLTAGGMVTGLPKYAGETVRQRGSSPKFQVFATALMTAQAEMTPGEVLADPEWRGHLVESAVGAHLLAAQSAGECRVFYWLDRNRELDFVVERGRRLTAIEVKGGQKKGSLPGLAAFVTALKTP